MSVQVAEERRRRTLQSWPGAAGGVWWSADCGRPHGPDVAVDVPDAVPGRRSPRL